MTAPRRLLAVTGANGYIGERLCQAAQDSGWDVIALARKPPAVRECRFVPYDLALPVDEQALEGAQAVVHLASDTQNPEPDADRERQACQRLIDAGGQAKALFVFVSSQTAAADAPTGYGRSKWALERLVLSAGGVVVRPGMVYGGPERGLFGRLCGLVRRLPALPAFLPTPRVQPIHVDDLAHALLAAATAPAQSLLEVADPQSISFTAFLRAIARHRVRKWQPVLPVPVPLVAALLHLAFRLTGNAVLQPARLLSLLKLRMMDPAAAMASLEITPRPLADGMHPSGSGRRHGLAREGRSLLRYIAGERPHTMMIVRYVRAIERFEDGKALPLRAVVHAFPSLLAFIEGPAPGKRDPRLATRIDIAFQIAEASVLTRRFLLARPVSFPLAVFQLICRGGAEAGALLLRPLLRPLLYPHAGQHQDISVRE
jgi:uncharacterized protein YbjT (DUF2867 family)